MLEARCILALLILALAGPRAAAGQNSSSAADSIAALVARYDSAWNRQDVASLKRLMSPQYRYFTSRGAVWQLANTLELVGSPEYKLRRARRSEIEVVQSGSVAVVSSRWEGEGSYKGNAFTDDQRCGLVWQQTGAEWRLLNEHCVQIVPRPARTGG